jgi:hypothetical protein
MLRTTAMIAVKSLDTLTRAISSLGRVSPAALRAGTDIRHEFASFAGLATQMPFDERPTMFALEQAFIDCPKDLVWSFMQSREGAVNKVYCPLPYVVRRFRNYMGMNLSDEFITLYISFRMSLAEETESTQKEYLTSLNSVLLQV